MKRTLTMTAAALGGASLLLGGVALVILFPDLSGLAWSPWSAMLLLGVLLGLGGTACLVGLFLVAARDQLALLRSVRDANRMLARNLLQVPVRIANAIPAGVSPLDIHARFEQLSQAIHTLAARQMQAGQNVATTILDEVLAAQDGLSKIETRMEESNRLSLAQIMRIGDLTARQADATSSKGTTFAEYAQLEALLALYATLPLKGPLTPLRGWAISPDCAAHLVSLALSSRPNLVLELGSGVSTVLLASALEKLGSGHVVTLEHDSAYAEHTLEQLRQQGLAHRVTIAHSPLVDVRLGDETWKWYDLRPLETLQGVDLVFVDGPPSNVQDLARYPALPLLADRLSENAVVVLDDAGRAQEIEMVDRWKSEFSHFSYRFLSHEKGTMEIRKPSSAKASAAAARRIS